MTETNERLARIETKVDALTVAVAKVCDGHVQHTVDIAKQKQQIKVILGVLGFLTLGGGSIAGFFKAFGG